MQLQPHEWQEFHSPTEWVEVRYKTNEKGRFMKKLCSRRREDARIWDKIYGTSRERVTHDLSHVARVIKDDVGYRSMRYGERVGSKPILETPEWGIEAMERYRKWRQEALPKGLVHPVILYFIDGFPIEDIAKCISRRTSIINDLIFEGLDLYAQEQGWL